MCSLEARRLRFMYFIRFSKKLRITLAGLIAVGFFLVGSCVSRKPVPTPAAQNKVIIFVPGLYGTALADKKTGERVFQTFGQALWGSIPLALSGAELGIPDAREIRPDGLLDQVSVVPLLYSIDAYGDSVDYLQREFGAEARVVAFSYDWRRDNTEAVQALGREVRKQREQGATSVALVGHSLGGILIGFYLRYGEQELGNAVETWEGTKTVDAVVIAGSPFHGAMAAFHDLLNGTSAGYAKTPLGALSLGSFPSYYEFLPRQSWASI